MDIFIFISFCLAFISFYGASIGYDTWGWNKEFNLLDLRLIDTTWEKVISFKAREENDDVILLIYVKLRIFRLIQSLFSILLIAILINGYLIIFNKEYLVISMADLFFFEQSQPPPPYKITLLAIQFIFFIIFAFWLKGYKAKMDADKKSLVVQDKKFGSRIVI